MLRVWQVAPRCEPDGKPITASRSASRAISRSRRFAAFARRATPAIEEQLSEPEPRPIDPRLRRPLADCDAALPQKPRAAFDARVAAVEPDAALAARLGMKLLDESEDDRFLAPNAS